MFCIKCGNKLNDGDKFCEKCGTPIDEPVAQATVETAINTEADSVAAEVIPEPVPVAVDADVVPQDEAEPILESVAEPVVEPEVNVEPAPKKAKKKMTKKKKFTILGIVAALVAVIATGSILFWDYVENFVVKTVSSPQQYYQFVEEKNVNELSETIGSAFGQLNEVFAKEAAAGAKTEISVQLGDVIIDALVKESGVDKAQLAWASNFGITANSSSKDGATSSNMALNINNKPIINIELVMKLEDMSYYIRIPELNNEYLLFKLPEMADDMAVLTSLDFSEILPDEKTVTTIVSKYLTTVINAIDDVEQERVTVEANGVEQSCTELTVTIDENSVVDVIEAVLKEFKDDKEIKGVIKNFYIAVNPDSSDKEFNDMYDEILDGIDDVLKETKSLKQGLGDFEIELVTWVDSKGEAIGREFKMDGFDGEIRYLSTHNGSDVGMEGIFEYDGAGFEYIGSGKIKGTKMAGNIELFVVDDEEKISFVNIAIKDYDVDLIEDNYVNGTFTVTFSKDACDEMTKSGEVPAELVKYLRNGAIELAVTSSDGKGTLKLTILYDSKVVISVSLASTEQTPANVSIPEGGKEISDEDDMMSYIENIKFDTLKANLIAAGMPTDLADGLFGLLENGFVAEPEPDYPNIDWNNGGFITGDEYYGDYTAPGVSDGAFGFDEF